MLLNGCIRKYGITFTISVTLLEVETNSIFKYLLFQGNFFLFSQIVKNVSLLLLQKVWKCFSYCSIYALLIKATWFYLQFYMDYYYPTRHDGRSTCTDPIFQIIMISLSLSHLTKVYDFFFTPVSPIITKPVIIMDQRVRNNEVITIRSHGNY